MSRFSGLILCAIFVLAKAEDVPFDFGDLFGGLGRGPAQCEMACSDGSTPFARQGHVPSHNGCGSPKYGNHIDIPLFESCCNDHDECYDRCGADRKQCDAAFEQCMQAKCAAVSDVLPSNPFSNLVEGAITSCGSLAGVMATTVKTWGCSAFLDSQEEGACQCPEGATLQRRKSEQTSILGIIGEAFVERAAQSGGLGSMMQAVQGLNTLLGEARALKAAEEAQQKLGVGPEGASPRTPTSSPPPPPGRPARPLVPPTPSPETAHTDL
ncbi:putative group XIIA secretory phospholipase A2 [Paratrimastix pyriformis]|uniref:Group XIIA secretory phospholipase A2 n=1 Tax=Paratrimastix pyriformis TaxID=342808 RepID=A0ABQ8UMA6_9EUKA|nr:putative group XIIA secretory phospholipase A2 [Paratrimastix pyriformis]